MKKVVVTGGSGRLGTRVIQDLLEHGYQVTCVDKSIPEQRLCKSIAVQMTNLGEVYGALSGADAVVHLAAIPAPGSFPNEVVFANNVMSTYCVLEASAQLGITKAVIASSESAYGFAWADEPFDPRYFPIDEEHPMLPEECYGLSKVVGEEIAHTFHRQKNMQIVSLRFANILSPEDYEQVIKIKDDPNRWRRILWSYIDVRDAAGACRLAIEKDGLGSSAYNICADTTSVDMKSLDIMSRFFPSVTDIRAEYAGFEGLYSNRKAKRDLSWYPAHQWRDFI
ncbi:NAD-dependent epimerase/dehydratase family protein [Paenibacillus thermotolerans]|uniref:NAD-dependent epimerase/dehydratase family protein n=1 Tax=Paenibacillus thermotolerans TaxID=3027807 RepID=UPI002367ECF6|nr:MULTISPECIES: NAD(P)-dependent oxidoreductase [unclassified Paenibacillus]